MQKAAIVGRLMQLYYNNRPFVSQLR